MADEMPLLALLTSEQEPPERVYQELHAQIVRRPGILSEVTREECGDGLNFGVVNHHQRITRVVRRLFSAQSQQSKYFPTQPIAEHTNPLLQRAVWILYKDNVKGLVGLLAPALANCLTVNNNSVRNLASAISQSDLVKDLITNASGAQAIKDWTQSSSVFRQEAATLAAWAEDVMAIIKVCCSDHGLVSEASRWEDVKRLKVLLRNVEHEQAAASAISVNQQRSTLGAGQGRVLQREEKKSSNIQQCAPQDFSINLCPEIEDLLTSLEHQIPTSSKQLEEVTKSLEYDKTVTILRVAAQSFPCSLCGVNFQASTTNLQTNDSVHSSHLISRSKFDMTVFGQNVGNWELLLSTPAFTTLRTMQRMNSSAKIEEKLTRLANGRGHIAPFAGSRIAKRRLKVPVFKTRCGGDLSILWQIDIEQVHQSNEQDSFSQVIRVWGITQTGKVNTVMANIAIVQSNWPAELAELCSRWEGSKAERHPATVISGGSEDSIASLRKHIGSDVRSMHQDILDLINKFCPLTEPLLNNRTSNVTAPEYPYKLSRQEIDLVRHYESSSLILGRSGTGKTTCLMYRLIGRYLQSISVGGEQPIRQVLLTRSPTLASNLRIYVRNCIATLGVGGDQEFSTEERRVTGVKNKATTAKASFSNITFPYVCTWEDFLQLLEDACSIIDGGNLRSQQQSISQDFQTMPATGGEGPCVDFTTFKLDYWPHLSRDVTKHLSLPLVFSEIMGVIKGSILSGKSLEPLTLDEYKQRSSRVAPAFSNEADREQVYQVYRAYEDLKHKYQQCDFVDRVIHVLRAVRTNPAVKRILRSILDELYIDEVQDQRATDLVLLLNLVKDSRFFHVAGDTAQAISQESTFRFEDVKALIHDHFSDECLRGEQSQLMHPKMFTLGFNYRSRQGIVDAGSFVMEVLWRTFPDTIDKLESEVGQLKGPKPILFLGCYQDSLTNVHFDSSELSASTACFGADQVILVRDETTKDYLRDVVGVAGLILTIVQSKGMEFDDVMIWNFFSTCSDSSGLRKLPALFRSEVGNFDGRKHVGMCTELKHLYVAVTRARNRLFILETSHRSDSSHFVELLTVSSPKPLVQIVSRDDATFMKQLELLRAGSASSPESWIRRGENFMSEEQFDEAFHCYQQAEDHRGMALASARRNVANGRTLRAQGDNHGAFKAFKDAIELFLSIEYISEAIDLCFLIGWFERAAGEYHIPMRFEAALIKEELSIERKDFTKAASLYCQAELYTKAADCYCMLEDYEQAAAMLWSGKNYDALVESLTKNRESLRGEVLHHYGALLKFPLKQGKICENQQAQAISLLGSSREREQVLRQLDMYEALEKMYRDEKRFEQAFDLCLQAGELDGAFELLRSEKFDLQSGGQRERQALQVLDYAICRELNEGARPKKRRERLLGDDTTQLDVHTLEARRLRWKRALNLLAKPPTGEIHELAELLIQANAIVCGLTSLYYCRTMNEDFQSSFLGMRRPWLQNVIRQIIWVSPYVQDEKVRSEILCRLFETKFSYILSDLESFVLYRLRTEWIQIRNFSALLEQMQLATQLGTFLGTQISQGLDKWLTLSPGYLGIQRRYLEVLRTITHWNAQAGQDQWRWKCMDLVRRLENDAHYPDVMVFLLRTCPSDLFIPQSWFFVHLPRIVRSMTGQNRPTATIEHLYEGCLMVFIRGVSRILRWMSEKQHPGSKFTAGGKRYEASLLLYRNAELLAICLFNMRSALVSDLKAFEGTAAFVNQTLSAIGCGRLQQGSDLKKMLNQLTSWFSEYSPKNSDKTALQNPLIIFSRGLGLGKALPSMTINLARKTVDDVLSISGSLPRSMFSRPSKMASHDDAYADATVETFEKLQRRWRVRIAYLRSQRDAAEGQWQLKTLKTTETCTNRIVQIRLRGLLLMRGYIIASELTRVQRSCQPVHNSIMSAVDTATDNFVCEHLDRALTLLVHIEDSLATVAEAISDDSLKRHIAAEQVEELRTRYDNAATTVEKMATEFEKVGDILKEIGLKVV
ncbi:MAG: hypothetical protein Q9222_000840 [Ikaeria aurantiellina]